MTAVANLGGEELKPPMIGIVQGDTGRPGDMDFPEGVCVVRSHSRLLSHHLVQTLVRGELAS